MLTVKTPVAAVAPSCMTAFPLSCGLEFVLVIEYRMPTVISELPPSNVTFPPSVTDVLVMLADVGAVTVGATPDSIVRVSSCSMIATADFAGF